MTADLVSACVIFAETPVRYKLWARGVDGLPTHARHSIPGFFRTVIRRVRTAREKSCMAGTADPGDGCWPVRAAVRCGPQPAPLVLFTAAPTPKPSSYPDHPDSYPAFDHPAEARATLLFQNAGGVPVCRFSPMLLSLSGFSLVCKGAIFQFCRTGPTP
jgi:hypothetical protein